MDPTPQVAMVSSLNLADFDDWCNRAAQAGQTPTVLDVREPWEVQMASVHADGFRLLTIPMRDVPLRLAELASDAVARQAPIACLCHHGIRSLQVAQFLLQNGFSQVLNLQGGIHAWSQQRDATVATY